MVMLDICEIALAALVLAHQNFTDDSSKSKGFKREVVVLTHGTHFHVLRVPLLRLICIGFFRQGKIEIGQLADGHEHAL
jgi:hypothetical protein